MPDIHETKDKDIKDAVTAAADKLFYDDTSNLAITYTFLLKSLPEPPDGALQYILALTLILFLYLYPVVRCLIIHWSRSIFASSLAKYNRNVFVRHGIRRCEKCRPMPNLYNRTFATSDDHSKDYLSWDKDGIPFVNDNSATDIIRSQRILFTGPLIPTLATLEKPEGLTTTTKFFGIMI